MTRNVGPALAELPPTRRALLIALRKRGEARAEELAAIGVFLAVFASHATRVHYLGHGIGTWRFFAALMLGSFSIAAFAAAFGLVDRRAWARPLTFAVEAAVICGYLLTFVFEPFRALVGMAVAVGVLALVLSPRADAAFAPVELG